VKRLVTVLFFGVMILLAACSEAEPEELSTAEFSLTATDLAFSTNQLEVVAGQSVKIALTNEGALEHDFSIMEMPHVGEIHAESNEMGGETMGHDMTSMEEQPEIHMAAAAGGRSTIEFTPSTAGEYEFYCTVAGHKEAGMAGMLVVKAP
jgi:uncharacterized cupredoxin-like copper-binding protein